VKKSYAARRLERLQGPVIRSITRFPKKDSTLDEVERRFSKLK
jgi:hypothetical protein